MERIIESWITRVENFYSLQSIPVKVLIFIVGVVGIYALGTLILGYLLGRSEVWRNNLQLFVLIKNSNR